MSKRAPPELPCDVGAVYCIIGTLFIVLKPDIIPSETELKKPKGTAYGNNLLPAHKLAFAFKNMYRPAAAVYSYYG